MKNGIFKKTYIVVKKAVKVVESDRLSVYAAQSSFFILISAFPFLMLLITMSKYLIPYDKDVLINAVYEYFPEWMQAYGLSAIDNLYGSISVPLLSITSLTLLWSASKGVNSLRVGVRNVYGIEDRRIYIYNRALSLFYTLAFIVLLAVTLIVLVFGQYLVSALASLPGVFPHILSGLLETKSIISLLLLTPFFMLAYRSFGGRELKFKKQFCGALFAATGWVTFSQLFNLYIRYSTRFSYIYGGLTTIVLYMLWLYFCMVLFLLGAELNKWLSTLDNSAIKVE